LRVKTMTKIDFKNGHQELVNRRADHWTDGWDRTEAWINGLLWGIVVTMALSIFVL